MPEVTVDPLTRIEGLGRIRLEVEDGALKDLKFQIMVAPRFYEYLLTGKPVEEAPRISQRICGICYTSHHLVSVKAIEDAWGVEPPETAVLLRRAMNAGGFVTSHSLHNAFLALPDLVDLPANARNFVALLGKYPDLGKIAVKIHAYGNKVVEATGGRVVHVVTSVPGGQTSGLSEQRRDELVEEGASTRGTCPTASSTRGWRPTSWASSTGWTTTSTTAIAGSSPATGRSWLGSDPTTT